MINVLTVFLVTATFLRGLTSDIYGVGVLVPPFFGEIEKYTKDIMLLYY